MSSNAIMGMDYAKEILGKPTYFEATFGKKLREDFRQVPITTKIDEKEQWFKIPEEEKYLNRLFGFRIDLPDGWDMKHMTGGKKIVSSVLLIAPSTKGKASTVTYSFSFIAKIPEKNESLQSLADSSMLSYKDFQRNKIIIDSQYKNTIAYEVFVPSMYINEGGAHLVFFFIERDEPKYPGSMIEYPIVFPASKNEGPQYYTQQPIYLRYKGKIYYIITMDTCESIFKISRNDLERLINNIIIVE